MVDKSETGHLYELENLEGGEPQEIQFIEKRLVSVPIFANDEKTIIAGYTKTKQFITINDGTTNEEVLKMLIDRTKKLNEKLPSRENSIAIIKLEEALMWFEKRTANRLAQNVENTPLPHKS